MGSNAVMLLLQQIQNDAKVLQTQAEADLKAAVTCPYGVTRVAQNGEFGALGKVLSVSMASRYMRVIQKVLVLP